MKKTFDYKIIVAELKEDPIHKLNTAFALMSIIPLLIMVYLVIGRYRIYKIFMGTNGILWLVAVTLSISGFFTAYLLVRKIISKMLQYSAECRKSEELKSAVIAEISHDFRTPLTTIKVSIESLLKQTVGTLTRIQMKMLNICLSTVKRLTQFVNMVLDISRIRLTKVDIKRELVDLKVLLEEELDMVSPIARQNRQNVLYTKGGRHIELWGDKKKLRQVIANLLSNAVKHTPAGGEIRIILNADEGTAKLEVINTGEGIPKDKIDMIFDKYYSIKEPSGKGVGLGLAIVKEIVELHKGKIDVFSQPGKETRFCLLLPRDLRARPRKIYKR